ncbi:MAG: HAD family hydrolase, partial [Myxococcota bacterium]
MRPTVVLFDVDGTLVVTGGAGRRALARAFGEVCGREDAMKGVELGGMTDRLILRAGLEALGRAFDERTAEALIEAYLGHLPDEVARSNGYRVLPGCRDAIAALARRPGYALGLGTGNVRRGAEIKLSRGGLDASFTFGGFGCDHEDRVELLRAGARRGAEQLGVERGACRVVVVGDTPRDVTAARGIGAECVCVETGGSAAAELLDLGATAAFPDLSAPGALEAIAG